MYYKWVLKESVSIDMVTLEGITFESKWISIKNNVLTINKNYAWDGCSPKYKLFGMVLGTWDGPIGSNGLQKCYYASLVHDALYQYKSSLIKLGYSREQADNEFLRLMRREDFILAASYYRGVRMFGEIYFKSVDN